MYKNTWWNIQNAAAHPKSNPRHSAANACAQLAPQDQCWKECLAQSSAAD
jgi:hypothetical protein